MNVLPQVIAVDDQPDNLIVLEKYLGREYVVTTFSGGQCLLAFFCGGWQG